MGLIQEPQPTLHITEKVGVPKCGVEATHCTCWALTTSIRPKVLLHTARGIVGARSLADSCRGIGRAVVEAGGLGKHENTEKAQDHSGSDTDRHTM
jgi:hypothetical protein